MGATFQTPPSTTAVSDAPLTQQLIDRVRELAPVIREHADDAERERRLSKPVHDALVAAGLQRLLTPRSLGGLEADLVTCARVVEEVALIDSAAAWALQAPNVNVWWAARPRHVVHARHAQNGQQ